jgi:hypothetical protein
MPPRGKGKKKKRSGSTPVSEMDFSAAENFIPPLNIDFNTSSGGSVFDDKVANISQLKEPSETQKRLSKLIDERANKFTYKDSTIADINRKTTRAVSGYKTKLGEFVYEDGKPVKANIRYHIHYTSDLEEHYMTGVLHNDSSKLIFPLKLSQFSIYNNLNKQKPMVLKPTVRKLTKKDYNKGIITRYFAKKANEIMSAPFEISKDQFNTSSLYVYATFQWKISGEKGIVGILNGLSINQAQKSIPNIGRFLSPFQFYKGRTTVVTEEDILNKLGVVKTTQQTTTEGATADTNTTSTTTTTTQTQTGPPPGVMGGGAGGAGGGGGGGY